MDAIDNGKFDDRMKQLDAMSVGEYLRKLNAGPEALATSTIWTRAMLSREPDEVSTLFFLRYLKAGGGLIKMRQDGKDGGQYLRTRQGTQTFCFKLAEALPAGSILLNEAVTSIEQLELKVVRVNGKLTCRKVICTVPPPTVKNISFSPALPEAKQKLLDSYGYRYYQKVMAIFKTPFWVHDGYCGLVSSFKGPVCVMRDTSVPQSDFHVITCFLAGESGRNWSKMSSEQERKEAVLSQLEGIFGSKARSELLDITGYLWNDERWAGYGCPTSSLPPGVLSKVGGELETHVGDVHFAGTETSNVWRGFMEGAARSGEREAAKVLADL